MTKTQLREEIGFSTSTLAKMSKGEYVSLEIIDNICLFLDCRVEEVIEMPLWKAIIFVLSTWEVLLTKWA